MMSGTMTALVIVLAIGLIATYGITVGYLLPREWDMLLCSLGSLF